MDAATFDRPFGLPVDVEPIVHVLDLPLPPSVNRAWKIRKNAKTGKRGMRRADKYESWIEQAGLALLVEYKKRGLKTICGRFTAIVEVRRDWTAIQPNKFDIDNRVKPLLDFCQKHRFIENDRDLEEYTVKWTATNAPRGCRITLRSVDA